MNIEDHLFNICLDHYICIFSFQNETSVVYIMGQTSTTFKPIYIWDCDSLMS
jgi:hypothetical protein